MLLWFVAGIVVGWVIELIIDWSFWRRALLSAKPADMATVNELAMLRRKVKEYEAQIQEMQSQLAKPVAALLSTDSSKIKE